ncbi:LLM class F420-dependent oxidoreductase [Streptacidiphilus pinicola]|uniref:LLM class F420-dependent oxidoreductase n=1 Tax=Streptacidiphilus pinicola TaxID=2219663 RepID=A0A2X0IPG9_9ACTN|nr:LLM class F420-dependent oxidoreductase [Streptacidiphilus pinicola]RAG85111.1 LLM class F420-dependent oxidoreductase [Streptacidiphilus pinicola]
MRLGLNLRYLGSLGAGARPRESARYVREAERLGFSVAWTAEVFSSDTVSLLGWLAAQTSRIDLGTAAMQIPARTPAMTAMTAATLDLLSEGRFRLGLGVSGPQVAEGWHGVPFDKPLARTREYVDVVRMALERKALAYEGEHYRLPLPDGPGKALQLGMRPRRKRIPVYLAAVGPANLRLAGEIADGWLSVFLQPEFAQESLAELRVGRERAGAELDGFDVVAAMPVATGGDLADCADRIRVFTTHYVGGMGSRRQNFYNRLMARTGFPAEADQVQKLYLDGQLRAATEAVPQEYLDRTALLGSPDRIADRLQAYAEAGVTTLSAMIFPDDAEQGVATLRALAEAVDKAGVGE